MTQPTKRESRKDADRDGRDSNRDADLPFRTQPEPKRQPTGEAPGPRGAANASAKEAIERATAAVGQDDGVR